MNLDDKKEKFENVIEFIQKELSSVRTSRATPSLVENIKVSVYGVETPMIQVASISSPEPKQLLIEPWDKNILKDIEKAIQTTSLGLSVSNEGTFVRVTMPPMTEETRNQVIKVLNEKIEKGKQNLRGVRDDVKEEIVKSEKDKEITEDDKFGLLEELDKMTREYTDEVGEIGKKKEEEIRI
jgi:ribosome recycling factor